MPRLARPKKGHPHRARDNQQWFFDWMVKETGKTLHFQPDGCGRLPHGVRSHDMIAIHTRSPAPRSSAAANTIRAPFSEVYRLFGEMKALAESWVLPDRNHNVSITHKGRGCAWEADIHAFVRD